MGPWEGVHRRLGPLEERSFYESRDCFHNSEVGMLKSAVLNGFYFTCDFFDYLNVLYRCSVLFFVFVYYEDGGGVIMV